MVCALSVMKRQLILACSGLRWASWSQLQCALFQCQEAGALEAGEGLGGWTSLPLHSERGGTGRAELRHAGYLVDKVFRSLIRARPVGSITAHI